MKKAIALLLLAATLCLSLASCSGTALPTQSTTSSTTSSTTIPTPPAPGDPVGAIKISEVCTSNETVIRDSAGIFHDYIELVNVSGSPVSLSDYYLSDDETNLKKSPLPGVMLPAGGRVIIFACGADKYLTAPTAGDDIYVGFKLSKRGDTLFLTNANGAAEDALIIPGLADDTCYGRPGLSSPLLATMRPTPGRDNLGSLIEYANANIGFSHDSGFYSQPFSLSLEIPEGCTVYYTMYDCEDPAVSSTAVMYTSPIEITDASERDNYFSQKIVSNSMYYPDLTIDKATVIRFVMQDENGVYGPVMTKTYFVGYDERDGYDGMSVVSVVSTPDDLYSSDKGIFTKNLWNGKGWEYEREASFTFIDGISGDTFTQIVGIRNQGASTRAAQQKNMALFARDEYDGNNRFVGHIFDGVDEIKSLVLRNDGTWKHNEGFLMDLVADRDIDTAVHRPCVVFLEGEYYGIYNIYVRTSKHELSEKYGVDKDDVVMIKKGQLEEGTVEDWNEYYAFINYVKSHDLSNPEYYAYVESRLDIQSFIDYVCAQIYYVNVDWSMSQNILFWKTRTVDPSNEYADGRWRMVLYDLDFAGGYVNSTYDQTQNAFTLTQPYTRIQAFSASNPLVYALIKNSDFCRRFVLTFQDMANVNFNYSRVEPIFNHLIKEVYGPNMQNHFERFNRYSSSGAIRDFKMYKQRTSKYLTFFRERFDYAMEDLKEQFGLSGTLANVTLTTSDIAAGTVGIGTSVPDMSQGSATLRYYSDYALTVRALPARGSSFLRWEITGASLSPGCSLTDPEISFFITSGDVVISCIYAD